MSWRFERTKKKFTGHRHNWLKIGFCLAVAICLVVGIPIFCGGCSSHIDQVLELQARATAELQSSIEASVMAQLKAAVLSFDSGAQAGVVEGDQVIGDGQKATVVHGDQVTSNIPAPLVWAMAGLIFALAAVVFLDRLRKYLGMILKWKRRAPAAK